MPLNRLTLLDTPVVSQEIITTTPFPTQYAGIGHMTLLSKSPQTHPPGHTADVVHLHLTRISHLLQNLHIAVLIEKLAGFTPGEGRGREGRGGGRGRGRGRGEGGEGGREGEGRGRGRGEGGEGERRREGRGRGEEKGGEGKGRGKGEGRGRGGSITTQGTLKVIHVPLISDLVWDTMKFIHADLSMVPIHILSGRSEWVNRYLLYASLYLFLLHV